MRDLLFSATCTLFLCGCWLFHTGSEDDARTSERPDLRVPNVRVPNIAGAPAIAQPRDAGPDAATVDPRCTTRELRKGERFEPVDMVWVVDSSRSMSDEQSRIEQIMNQFVSDAEARNFDVRLVMVTASNIVPAPLGTDPKRYRFVQRDVRSHEPLDALLEEWPRYADFLRPEAALHFVIVTDDDSDLPAQDFKRELDRLLGRPYTVHAVASPDVGGQPCISERASAQCMNPTDRTRAVCGAAAIGRQYLELAEQSGGEEISVCVDDWREVFGPLLEAVTPTAIPCTIDFDESAALDATRVEILLGLGMFRLLQVAGPRACNAVPEGYYFVDGTTGTQLSLCPAACAATTGESVTLVVSTYCDGPQ